MNPDPLWYKNAIFYEVYVRAFCDSNQDGQGDLPGLVSKLEYIRDLGVDCIWLLPLYPSPLLDDGYDIADYYGIHPDYGTLNDFKVLLDAAHSLNMRVITDLVLNHTSDLHPWFQAARKDRNSPFRDFYVWSDTPEKFKEARIIFMDTEKSNWAWDEAAGQFYWHRFYSSQPDLNYANPLVRQEMINVLKYWLDMGVDGFRADAVPYLFERDGTNCENLPETHQYIKEIRQFMDEYYPGKLLLCEANQWPEDVRPYFGDGDEFHMGFHFPIMPRIFSAVRKADVSPMKWIMNRTPPIPGNCQWCVFLRNHDELTLEMVTAEEREWMWQEYAPELRMRLNLGIRRRLAALLDYDQMKIELVNSLLFTLPGSPIIYYGDEIGMGDNIWLPDRNGVRTPMQWEEQQENLTEIHSGTGSVNVKSQTANPTSLLSVIRHMISLRKKYPVFGSGDFTWVECDSKSVASYIRAYQGEKLLIVNNLSGLKLKVVLSLPYNSPNPFIDLLSNRLIYNTTGEKLALWLDPFQYLWIKI